jgi:hypothetical protein
LLVDGLTHLVAGLLAWLAAQFGTAANLMLARLSTGVRIIFRYWFQIELCFEYLSRMCLYARPGNMSQFLADVLGDIGAAGDGEPLDIRERM